MVIADLPGSRSFAAINICKVTVRPGPKNSCFGPSSASF